MRESWSMNRKGFASIYFLSVFSGIAVLTAVIALNESNRLKAAANLRRISEYQSAENAVLCEVKCALRNEKMQDGSFQSGPASFTLKYEDEMVTATIESPVSEILQIAVDLEKHAVIDFFSLRNETVEK